jgi:phosphosulfolactate synthase
MVIDWGIGPNAQEDLVVTEADYFDFAKVAVGISRLLSNETLTGKIKHYQEHGVEPFPGGMYLEYAEVYGKTDLYFPAVARAGYRWVEVSDNLAPVGVEWKRRMIREAVEKFGLSVLGEVGKKEGIENTVSLVDNARACLDAGSRIVLLEAAELVSGDVDTARAVEAVVEVIGPERVMFELPGPWIAGVSASDIHRMRGRLIARYGPEVNLGNVSPADLVSLEAYRRGLGVNAGKAKS